ncbi:transposase, partial [Selenomonas sp. FOBRC9]
LQEVFGDIPVYYAHPYTPSERGTNERQNGMVRRFIPKGTDIACLTPDTIQQVEDWMNNLPRKILGYDTPKERFDSYVAQFAAS